MNILKDLRKDFLYETQKKGIRKEPLQNYTIIIKVKTWKTIKLEDSNKAISQKLEQKCKVTENMREKKKERLSPGGPSFDK